MGGRVYVFEILVLWFVSDFTKAMLSQVLFKMFASIERTLLKEYFIELWIRVCHEKNHRITLIFPDLKLFLQKLKGK